MALADARPQPAPARTRRGPDRILSAARWLLLPALVLVLWELAVGLGWLRPFSFPPPSRLAAALAELVMRGFPQGERLWVHVGMTLLRVLEGCVLAIAAAIPLGILIGSVRALDQLTLPIITFARSVASLSLLPLAWARAGAPVSARRLSDAAWGMAGVLLVFGSWEAAARLGLVDPLFLPAPSQALAVTLERMPPDVLAGHVLASLARIAWGFSLGALCGIALGIALGWYRTLDRLLRPLIDLLRPIPPLAWIPIAIVWFGLGEPSKVFVIFLGAFFPIWTNTYKGMTAIDPILFRAAQTMGHQGPSLLFKVAIPAVMPDVATGIRVGWGLSFGVLVAAELIAAERGMGFMIMEARQLGEIGIVIFGIILIGATNLASDYAIGALIRRRIGRWHAV